MAFQELGLVKNVSKAPHCWGSFEVPPGTIGRVPIEVIESLRKHPSRELIVVDDDPKLCPFIRTPHAPSSARYLK